MSVTSGWNKKELREVQRALKKLSPRNDIKLNGIIGDALKKSASPMVTALKNEIKSNNLDDTGQMRRSIAAIKAKKTKNGAAVYVGPRVKGAYRSMDKTGFYFYFLEHGFKSGYGKSKERTNYYKGENMLEEIKSTEPQVLSKLKPNIDIILARRCKKLGFNYG